MGKKIIHKGIVRNTPQSSSLDGEMEDIFNLRLKDGSWRPITDMEFISGLPANNYGNIYIHNTTLYKHLLGIESGKLYYFADMNTSGVVTMLNPRVELISLTPNAKIFSFFNIIEFLDTDGMHALFFDKGEYKILDTDSNGNIGTKYLSPEGMLDIRVCPEYFDNQQVEWQYYTELNNIVPMDPNGTIFDTEYMDTMIAKCKGQTQLIKDHIKRQGELTGFFIAISAVEYYDGTFSIISRPILCNQANDNQIRFGSYSAPYGTTATGTTENADVKNDFSTCLPFRDLNNTEYYSWGKPKENITISKNEQDLEDIIVYKTFLKHKDEYNIGVHEMMNPHRDDFGIANNTFSYFDNLNKGMYNVENPTKTASSYMRNFTFNSAKTSLGGTSVYLNHYVTTNKLQVKPYVRIDSKYEHIIKNICVFITQEVDGLDFNNLCYNHVHPITNSFECLYASYYYKMKSNADVKKELSNLKNFYCVHKISLSDYNDMVDAGQWVTLDIKDTLPNITAQEQLTMDAYNRNKVIPKCGINYNGKLHIGNIKERLFYGFPIDYFIYRNPKCTLDASYNDGSSMIDNRILTNKEIYKNDNGQPFERNARIGSIYGDTYISADYIIKVTLDKDRQEVLVYRQRLKNEEYALHCINQMLAYPDIDAKEIEIFIYCTRMGNGGYKNVLIFNEKFELYDNGSLPYTFYIRDNLRPIYINTPDAFIKRLNYLNPDYAGDTKIIATNNNSWFYRPNIIKVSNVNNPLLFPVANTYTIGNNELIGFGSNTIDLSVGQVGASPLFVFAKDGIYGLFVDTSGQLTYTNSRPISREVCNNADSIQSIDNGLIFTTDRGLMQISGTKVTDLSDVAEGQVLDFTNANSLDYLKEAAFAIDCKRFGDLIKCSNTFLDYIQGANIGYNYLKREIWVTNPTKDYSYILGGYGWTRTNQVCERYINDYPFYYAMQTNGQLKKLGFETGDNAPIYFITRPIKLDTEEFKQGYRIILRAYLDAVDISSIAIFGSYDCRRFAYIGGIDKQYTTKDIGSVLARVDCKYFRFAMFSNASKDSYIDYTELSATSKILNNKLR